MTTVLFWVGAVHVAIYAIVGTTALGSIVINWAVRRFGLHKEMLRAYGRILVERQEARVGRP